MAEYKGKKVTLNSPRALRKGEPGYGKKRKVVFVMGCSSESKRVKRITFGDAKLGMHIRDKSRKKSYCAWYYFIQNRGNVRRTKERFSKY